ncbi:MAG: type II 3-dehydroquinate dehydratase [Bacteroidales bacterium]|nr:type II 3-dehydroquinate dehydratase [Bacteroidales bacterium]
MRILIINGPNLNLLGQREPAIYGAQSFDDYLDTLRQAYPQVQIDYFQSNHEGDIIDRIHQAGYGNLSNLSNPSPCDGIILNAGAYTHTSIAIHDAIKAVTIPTIEVHISNVHTREPFRHHSFISPVAHGIIIGFGIDGYRLALEGLLKMLAR